MRRLIYIALITVFTISCSIERPKGKTEAEVLYKEAQELVKDNRYILATEKLNTLKSQYPYSYYSTFAELMLADILFFQENFEEAAAAYILFKDFHPKHKKMDYVIWKIAESYYSQRPSTYDRDLTPAIKAIKYYNELRSLYPSSKLLKDADEKIKICTEMLINKEKYIANFYFKTKDFDSAKFRYEGMLKEISVREVKVVALEKLMRIGRRTSDKNLCQKHFKQSKSILRRASEKQRKAVEQQYSKCIL